MRPIVPGVGTPPNRFMTDEIFSPTADLFLPKLDPFGAGANALASWMESIAAGVETNAMNAAAAAETALALANFKGAWASLAGALAPPASVWHDDAVWLLLNPIYDVTQYVPGVVGDWKRMFTLGVARFAVVEVADDYVGGARQWVEQTANNKTVWMPPAPPPGTEFGYGVKGAVTGSILNLNGEKFEGEDIGFIEWDGPANSGRPFLFVSPAVGWRVV